MGKIFFKKRSKTTIQTGHETKLNDDTGQQNNLGYQTKQEAEI